MADDRIGTPTALRALDAIIAHANRHTPERLADVIDTLELYGAAEENLEDTAVGHYIADRMLSEGVAPAIYTIYMAPNITVINSRTRTVIATADTTGTLSELHDLITEGTDGFDLHRDPEPWGPCDTAEHETLVTLTGPIGPRDGRYFASITAMTIHDF